MFTIYKSKKESEKAIIILNFNLVNFKIQIILFEVCENIYIEYCGTKLAALESTVF